MWGRSSPAAERARSAASRAGRPRRARRTRYRTPTTPAAYWDTTWQPAAPDAARHPTSAKRARGQCWAGRRPTTARRRIDRQVPDAAAHTPATAERGPHSPSLPRPAHPTRIAPGPALTALALPAADDAAGQQVHPRMTRAQAVSRLNTSDATSTQQVLHNSPSPVTPGRA